MIHFTPMSKNRKTGFMPVSGTKAETCPDSCPLKGRGCYANYGAIKIHWDRLNNGETGISFSEFFQKIAKLPKGQIWRHAQFGDLPHDNQKIAKAFIRSLTQANSGKRGFTYSHHKVCGDCETAKHNRNEIAIANANGFTVNLSANSLQDADNKKALQIGPICVNLPKVSPNTVFTPKGNKVIVCPSQQKDEVTCLSCRLCANAKRGVIIGFRAHGSGAKYIK